MRVNLEARAAAAAQRRAETRERLLEGALQVIAAKGPEAVSVEDFTAAAGVSRATFYNYYATVPEFIAALNTRLATELSARLDDVRASIADPVVQLAALMHRIWLAVADNPQQGWVMARIEAAGAARQPVWEEDFTALYRSAVQAGRFHGDEAAARTLTFGAMRMGFRDLFVGDVGRDHAEPLVAAILAGCGLPFAEAVEISRAQAAAARAHAKAPGAE